MPLNTALASIQRAMSGFAMSLVELITEKGCP